jgi:hypothetical protein
MRHGSLRLHHGNEEAEMDKTSVDDWSSGWVFFAGFILIFAGIARIFDAIWAFRFNGQVPDDLNGALFGDSLTAYAWIWLIVGIILVVAAILLFSGSQFGRWIGIIAAAIGGLSAVTWLPYYPFWSAVYVALAFLIIYGLVVHAPSSRAGAS